MDLEYIVEYLAVNIFWIYITNRFIGKFFEAKKYSELIQKTVLLFFYILNSSMNLFLHEPMWNLFTSILGIFMLTCIYEASVLKKIVITGMVYAISIGCDMVVAVGIGSYVRGMQLGIINNILSYFLIFIVELLIEKGLHLGKQEEVFTGKMWMLIGVPILSVAVICVQTVNRIANKQVALTSMFALLFINVMVFYLYDSLRSSYAKQYRSSILEHEVEEYQNQLSIMKESQDRMESLKHDMKNHFLALSHMLKNDSIEEMEKYLGQMIQITEYEKDYVATGNTNIDSVLNYKIQQAREKEISVTTDVKIVEQMEVDFFDINIIMGNLLDNAIRAAESADTKYIHIEMELDRGVLYIMMKNSCNGNIKRDGEKWITTKRNKEKHGYGIENVRKTVEKYHGSMEVNYDEGEFCINLLMYLV